MTPCLRQSQFGDLEGVHLDGCRLLSRRCSPVEDYFAESVAAGCCGIWTGSESASFSTVAWRSVVQWNGSPYFVFFLGKAAAFDSSLNSLHPDHRTEMLEDQEERKALYLLDGWFAPYRSVGQSEQATNASRVASNSGSSSCSAAARSIQYDDVAADLPDFATVNWYLI